MSFTVSYLYRLRDQMTPAMEKIKKSSGRMSTEIENNRSRMSKGMAGISKTNQKMLQEMESTRTKMFEGMRKPILNEGATRATQAEIQRIGNEMGRASDKISRERKKIQSNFKEIGKQARLMGREMMIFGGATLAPMALMAREAMQFEKGVAEIGTLMPTKTLAGVKEEFSSMLLDISSSFGKNAEDVTKSAYDAVSAGIPGTKEALQEFMQASAKASVAGSVDLGVAVDGVTSVMNAFRKEGLKTIDITDSMFTAVRLGKTTFGELSASMFNVSPVASTLGLKLDEVTMAIAAVTAKGVPTTVVTTQMRAMLVELSKSSTKVSQVFKKISGKSFPDFVKGGGTLQEALMMIREKADKANVQLSDIFSSQEAGSIALTLTGDDVYKKDLEEVRMKAGATDKQFQTMADSASFKYDKAIANFKNMSIVLGSQLLPTLTKSAEKFSSFVGWIANFIKENPNLSSAIIITTAVLGALVFGLGTLAFTVGSVMNGISVLQVGFLKMAVGMGWSTTSFGAFTASVWASTVAMLASPLFWIPVAIIAVGVAIWQLIKHWDAIKEAVTGAFVKMYNSVAEFYNKYKGIITVLAIPLLPFILAIKGVILVFKGIYYAIKWVVDLVMPYLTQFANFCGETFGVIKAFWSEYFGDFANDVSIAFQPIVDALMWVENKARAIFKLMGIELPNMDLIAEKSAGASSSALQSADYFTGNENYSYSPATATSLPAKEAVKVNVKSDVGGTLRIAFDKQGNPQVKESKSNGNLGFQVGGM